MSGPGAARVGDCAAEPAAKVNRTHPCGFMATVWFNRRTRPKPICTC